MKKTVKEIAIITARNLRKEQTKAEKKFWSKVHNKQFNGYKFLRQHPIYYEYEGRQRFFIADFVCYELDLVVEIDGGMHEKQKDYDKTRSIIMEKQRNFRVKRYSNKEVLLDINRVLLDILN